MTVEKSHGKEMGTRLLILPTVGHAFHIASDGSVANTRHNFTKRLGPSTSYNNLVYHHCILFAVLLLVVSLEFA